MKHRFDVELVAGQNVRLTKTVTAKSLGAALRQACHIAVKSGFSEPGNRAVIERRDA